nr:hypothetical protein [Anoxybacillus caldiproteolyticus]
MDAAKKESIAHFVMLSSYGSGDPQAIPKIAHYLKAKGKRIDT